MTPLYLLYDNSTVIGGDILAVTKANTEEEATQIFIRANRTDEDCLEQKEHSVEKADFRLIE